jgi:hypothetical protein
MRLLSFPPEVVRLARCVGFSCCLLMLAIGCKGAKVIETAEVSGTVKFQNQPLPGGMIQFVAANGESTGSGTIEENGTYKVSAPVGDCKITVDNSTLNKQPTRRGPQAPATKPMLKRPGSEAPKTSLGRYVPIPQKYQAADTTDLTYTVKKGAAQTHDVELK